MADRPLELAEADERLSDEKVENVLREMQGRMEAGKTIYGPDGRPLIEPVVDDRTVTYAKDGESYSIEPEQLIMRAGRMLRDGMSLRAIRSELDLKDVSDRVLESACKLGIAWLDAAIAEGREPAESKTIVGYAEAQSEDESAPVAPGVQYQMDERVNVEARARENVRRKKAGGKALPVKGGTPGLVLTEGRPVDG